MHAMRLLVALVLTLSAATSAQQCNEARVLFLVDGSESVPNNAFEDGLQFALDSAHALLSGSSSTLQASVAIAQFAGDVDGSGVALTQDLDEFGTAVEAQRTQSKGSTSLASVLLRTATLAQRPGVNANVLILVTDGRIDEPRAEVQGSFSTLEAAGVHVVTVGIGRCLGPARLRNWASRPELALGVLEDTISSATALVAALGQDADLDICTRTPGSTQVRPTLSPAATTTPEPSTSDLGDGRLLCNGGLYQGTSTRCTVPCDANCNLCVKGAEGVCLECLNGLFLLNGACVEEAQCPDTFLKLFKGNSQGSACEPVTECLGPTCEPTLLTLPLRLTFPAREVDTWSDEDSEAVRNALASGLQVPVGHVQARRLAPGSVVLSTDIVDYSRIESARIGQDLVNNGNIAFPSSLGSVAAIAGEPFVQTSGSDATLPEQLSDRSSSTTTSTEDEDPDLTPLIIGIIVLAILCLIILEAVLYVWCSWRKEVKEQNKKAEYLEQSYRRRGTSQPMYTPGSNTASERSSPGTTPGSRAGNSNLIMNPMYSEQDFSYL